MRLRLRPPVPPVTMVNLPLRLRQKPPAPPMTMENIQLRLRLRLRSDSGSLRELQGASGSLR